MAERTIRTVKYGNTERKSFAQIQEVIDMPYLIEVQKASYEEFLEHGIDEVFKDFSPITDLSNRIELHFIGHKFDGKPKYSEKECKDRDATYAAPLKVKVRQVKTETGEVIEQDVFMGDFPLMTPNGSFIINGAERVVVSQLVRSPGVVFDATPDHKTGQLHYSAANIPLRGAWLEFTEDDKGVLWVQMDRQRKVHASVLMRALASITGDDKFKNNPKRNWIGANYPVASDAGIVRLFGYEPLIEGTVEKDSYKTADEGLIELNRKLRPGEVPNVDSIRGYVEGQFFDRHKYDLSRVGRYKFNKKLALGARITGRIAAEDVVDANGVLYVKKGELISEETAYNIQNAGINSVSVLAGVARNSAPRFAGFIAAEEVKGANGKAIVNAGDEITVEKSKALSQLDIPAVRVAVKDDARVISDFTSLGVKATALETGVVCGVEVEAGEVLTLEKAHEIARVFTSLTSEARLEYERVKDNERLKNAIESVIRAQFVRNIVLEIPNEHDDEKFTVIGNRHVALDGYLPEGVTPVSLGVREKVYYPVLQSLMEEANGDDDLLCVLISQNVDKLVSKHILVDDVIATVNYLIGLRYGLGYIDNIDHLGNRRVRSVGELLQHQFRTGIARLERGIHERMQIQNEAEVSPQSLINTRPVSSAIKEFFGSSQLSQFMDESNPIAELTHKRKLSALGPGGLNRERASFAVRDVHYTHYSRMCPIETPEGQNIGLISSLSSYARINEYGFIEAPYRKVEKVYDEHGNVINGRVTDEVVYMPADEEDRYRVAQAGEELNPDGTFAKTRVLMRYRDDIAEVDRTLIDYVDVSPRQMISVATALIPFLENDDTNRALMGSNMQRQAVPLLKPEAPIVGTGIEHKIAYDSGVMVIAREDGEVTYVDANEIHVRENNGKVMSYTLKKFVGSNQGTCINQRPIVSTGDKVKKGQVLADGHSTQNAELALGRNILVGFMAWEGYNYEDAILISERLVKDDVFTSIHIEKLELEARDTKLGPEEMTRDIPNLGDDALKNLDEDGIVRVGAEVDSGDILVGKVTPKGETELTPEERLLRAIFGDKAREVRDTSLRVPHGSGGIVVDVKIFTRANRDEMNPGVNKLVRVYIAQKRKISVGDKMAGRHGNKGVISRILPEEDMPFMADGTPLQIVLNPLGVPSRMNIGQVLEVHLGLVAKALGWKVATPVFDGALESDISKLLKENGFTNPDGEVDGKIQMYDGRTGEPFENRATVGYMYMIKLIHLVDDKIHARSTGPYSLVTQQPLGGKAQFGGQRFGEMEVWALYAYGAANILQEIMTVKSDDVVGRVKTYESIVKGLNLSEPGVPESFKVLIKELQSLALDVKVLTENKEEIGIKDLIEDELDEPEDKSRFKHFDAGKINLVDEIDPLGKLDDDVAFDDLDDDDEGKEGNLFSDEDDISLDDLDDPFADSDFDDLDDLDDDLDTDGDEAPAAKPKKKGKKA